MASFVALNFCLLYNYLLSTPDPASLVSASQQETVSVHLFADHVSIPLALYNNIYFGNS